MFLVGKCHIAIKTSNVHCPLKQKLPVSKGPQMNEACHCRTLEKVGNQCLWPTVINPSNCLANQLDKG